MRFRLTLIVLALNFTGPAEAQTADYIYPHHEQPRFSNYGTIGVIMMPSARMHKEGTVGFTWSHLDPY